MGEIAGEYSDLVFITSDNPRNEDPLKIIAEIEVGVKEKVVEYYAISDRREAIYKAVAAAKMNDVVIIAGKGHENYQIGERQQVPLRRPRSCFRGTRPPGRRSLSVRRPDQVTENVSLSGRKLVKFQSESDLEDVIRDLAVNSTFIPSASGTNKRTVSPSVTSPELNTKHPSRLTSLIDPGKRPLDPCHSTSTSTG